MTRDAVLVAEGQPAGLQVQVKVEGTWPAAAPLPAAFPAPEAAGATPPPPPANTLGLALLLALVGGALLNLMPCVFPVLSLKLIGLAQHRTHSGPLAAHGIAFAAGVVLSFVLLAFPAKGATARAGSA